MALIVLFVLLGLTVVAMAIVNQRRRTQALARLRHAAPLPEMSQEEIQAQVDFVVKRFEAMAQLVDDKSLSPDEVMASFDIFAAEVAAMDTHGHHVTGFEATRKIFLEQLAKREAESGS